ncbi:MAG: hypothetical protein FD167_3242 [bacterium]|nr:MAG: hypothetical protein FD167_3242 [bacterium]
MQLSSQEQELMSTQFLAPCVLGGRVQTKVSHLVYKFDPQPKDFVGWAIFQPINEKMAKVVEEASLPMVSEYLKLFKAFRFRLAYKLESQTWLAYPVNEADMRQRLGLVKPVAIHLATEATEMEQVVVRYDGGAWWFEDVDPSADPIIAEELRTVLRKKVPAKDLRFANLTPEMRTTYSLIEDKEKKEREQKIKLLQNCDETRLKEALRVGGNARLHQFRDQGRFWVVDWFTSDDQRHTSAISKHDLTVISSGICLSGYDRNFDLQSLVKVIEQRDN